MKGNPKDIKTITTCLQGISQQVGQLFHITEKELKPSIKELTDKVEANQSTTIDKINCLENKIVNTRATIKLWERIWLIILSGGFVLLTAIISAWR